MKPVEKILVIRHGALGDFCMAAGWMQAVRNAHPDARITLLTQSFLESFAWRLGLFDRIVSDDRKHWLSFDWLRICWNVIASEEWTFIYDFQGNHRTLDIYRRVAMFFSSHSLKWVSFRDGEFRVWATPSKRRFTFSRPHISIVDFAYRTRFDFSGILGNPEVMRRVPARYAVIIPGCSSAHPEKRWPAEKYRELSCWLAQKGLGSIVLGTASELNAIETICRNNDHAISFMGVSSIEDIPELARRSRIVVGNDTGPTHLCRLAGAYTVVLLPSKSAHLVKDVPYQRFLLADQVSKISLEEVKRACEI